VSIPRLKYTRPDARNISSGFIWNKRPRKVNMEYRIAATTKLKTVILTVGLSPVFFDVSRPTITALPLDKEILE
jgi:hypothetical protein